MAARIAGITIEIGGDTTKLTTALSKVDNALRRTQTNLRDISKGLKLDPGNTSLLKDKQLELASAIDQTKQKLEQEKQAMEQMQNAKGFDATSDSARNLQTQIDLDTVALRDLERQAQQASSVLGAQMQAAGQRMQEVGDKIKSVGDKIKGIGQGLTASVTLPLVAVGTKAVKSFAEVDKTMTLTRSTMGATAKEADMLDKAMKDAAANSVFGMEDAAGATLNFARAGLNAGEAAAALAPAMNLAAGEGGNLDIVSAGLVSTINGFGDSFGNAEKYADVFANACDNSQLKVDDLSQAFSTAAPVFKAAGYEVEDAALYMGTMANAGIPASEAANALKTGLARLVSPAKEGADKMQELGINITNADGSMKDSVTVQRELHNAFTKLSESEQIAAASAIFGKNQMSNWLALINTAPSEVQSLGSALEKQGTSAKRAADMMEGFAGKILQLKSQLNVAANELGEALAPAIEKVTNKVTKLVEWFRSLSDSQKQMVAKMALVAAAIGPVLMAVGSLVSSVGSIVSVVGSATSAIGSLMTSAGGLSGVMAALASPVGIAAAAVAAFTAGFAYLMTTNEEFRNGIMKTVSTLQNNFATTLTNLQPQLEKIGEVINNLLQLLAPYIEVLFNHIAEKINALMNVISGLITFISANLQMIQAAVQAFYALITGDTTAFQQAMTTMFQSWVTAIEAIFTTFFSFVTGAFSAFGANLSGITTNTWNTIKNAVQTAITNIGQAIQTKWENIKAITTTLLNTILNAFRDIFSQIKNAVEEKIGEVKERIQSGMEEAASYLMSLPGEAFSWGADIIGGLIDGIMSKMGELKNAVSKAASAISSYLHFSEPDVGPLSDFHTYMPDMMDLLVKGINNGIPKVAQAMNGLASTMVPTMGQPQTAVGSVNITVYGAPGQNVNELADIIEQRITDNTIRRGVAVG